MRRLMFLGLTLISIGPAPAVLAETLSIRQAVVLGLEHNYALRASALDNERAAAGIVSALARFDTTAELAAGAGGSKTPAASDGIAKDELTSATLNAEAAVSKLFTSGLTARLALQNSRSNTDALADRLDPAYRTSLTLDLTQPLLKDRGTTVNTAEMRLAENHRQQAAFGHLVQVQRLAADIELAYLALAQAQEDLRAAKLALTLAQELLSGNNRKLEVGLIPASEVSEASAAVAGREEAALLAAQAETLARNRLLALIDQGEAQLPTHWQAELSGADPGQVPALEELLASGLTQRPELQQARLEIGARKIVLIYAKNQRLPRLDLEASLGVNGLAGDDDGAGSHYAGDWHDAFSNTLDGNGSHWYAGLRFSMPLQNRGAQAGWRDAVARERQALYRLYDAETVIEMTIRSAYTNLSLGRARLEVAHRFAELASTTLEQENRRLEEGLSDTFRIINFQNGLITARLREVAARADYQRSLVNLYLAAGTNLARYDIFAALPHQGAQP